MNYERVELTADQAKLWEQTRCRLLWVSPFFTHIFYEMLNNAGSEDIALFTKDVPIAATDGENLLLNPDTFFKYDLDERVFACAHEILHCVFNHCGRNFRYKKSGKIHYDDGTTLPYDAQIANVAMDLVINDMLIDSKVGKFNKDWLHDKKFGTMNDSWIDVYKNVFKQQQGGGKGQGQGQGPSGQGFDIHLDPGTSQGKDPSSADAARSDASWGQAIAGAAAVAKAMGKMPAGLERVISEVLDPAVDWKERIRALFSRKVGSGSYDWRKADRRLISRLKDPIYSPARAGFGCGTIVVAVDTSGSIGQKELDMFFGEIFGILSDCTPRELIIKWCDAQVQRIDHCDDVGDLMALRNKPAPGGGGTSFIPVFDSIAAMGVQPDALVYLTDGMGSFPDRAPSYPVIWGNIYPNSKYPFGDVVDIPKQA